MLTGCLQKINLLWSNFWIGVRYSFMICNRCVQESRHFLRKGKSLSEEQHLFDSGLSRNCIARLLPYFHKENSPWVLWHTLPTNWMPNSWPNEENTIFSYRWITVICSKSTFLNLDRKTSLRFFLGGGRGGVIAFSRTRYHDFKV